MEKTANKAEFWKLLTEEGSEEATIMLYGFIGEEYTFDEESERWTMSGVTDLAFVKELNRLAEKYKVIHLRINSPGGSTFHGAAIMTAIQACTAEVHTWNDGIAASMAADIWMCGHRRHMAKNALMMIHAAWDYCVGHAQDMRDCAEFLDKTNTAAITAVAASTGKSEEEIRKAWYDDYKDHWLTYPEATASGLVTETGDEYHAADPEKLNRMTYKQLLEHFEKKNHPEAPGLMKRIGDAFMQAVRKRGGNKSTHTVINNTDMTQEEFKKSIADGTLDIAAVKSILAEAEQSNQPATPATPPAEPAENAALQALRADNDALKQQLTALDTRIAELAKTPGAAKAAPGMPDGDPAGVQVNGIAVPDALKAFNESMAAAAAEHDTPRFVGTPKSV